MDGYNHYITIDSSNFVIDAFSDAFRMPQSTDIRVATNAGRHYNPVITDSQGNFIYKWDGTQMVDRTQDLDYLLPIAKAKKKKEISDAVGAKIIGGYQSTVVLASTGKAHFYGTALDDQQNMTASRAYAIAYPANSIGYRPQDVVQRVTHTNSEFIQVSDGVFARINSLLDQGYAYYNQLGAAQSLADVDAIVVNVT